MSQLINTIVIAVCLIVGLRLVPVWTDHLWPMLWPGLVLLWLASPVLGKFLKGKLKLYLIAFAIVVSVSMLGSAAHIVDFLGGRLFPGYQPAQAVAGLPPHFPGAVGYILYYLFNITFFAAVIAVPAWLVIQYIRDQMKEGWSWKEEFGESVKSYRYRLSGSQGSGTGDGRLTSRSYRSLSQSRNPSGAARLGPPPDNSV